MGGFILPIMFDALVDLTGVHSSALSRKRPVPSHFS